MSNNPNHSDRFYPCQACGEVFEPEGSYHCNAEAVLDVEKILSHGEIEQSWIIESLNNIIEYLEENEG